MAEGVNAVCPAANRAIEIIGKTAAMEPPGRCSGVGSRVGFTASKVGGVAFEKPAEAISAGAIRRFSAAT